MMNLRAILVCVDYADLLAVTLPYNRRHFEEVWVVTTPNDIPTLQVATANNASTFVTTAFYDDGALFNKWKALEQGLDRMKREGWICLMDADVLWPKKAPLDLQAGYLYSPLRRMFLNLANPIPSEPKWCYCPVHPNVQEWAGYSQIFHASDPVLQDTPWHQIDWKHAGGADSFFQQRWQSHMKLRPNWEVLHLGEAGQNWCGRVTPYLDGTKPLDTQEKANKLRHFIRNRHKGPKQFDHEKVNEKTPLPSE